MKKVPAICVCGLLNVLILSAQSTDWKWALSPSAGNLCTEYDVATDNKGNVFMTGTFSYGSITFDNTTLLNTTQSGAVFIVKYDGSGNLIWAKCSSSTNFDLGYGIATDGSGSVYVTGSFNSDTIRFDTISLINQSSGGSNIFIAKFDSLGNVKWAKSFGGNGSDDAWYVTTDETGNVYFTGSFRSDSITFGAITLFNESVTNSDCMYLAKYDGFGNSLWAKSAIGSNNSAYNIAVDTKGNAYVVGQFSSDSITLGSTTLYNGGSYDFMTQEYPRNMFVAKYDIQGNILWAKGAATNSDAFAYGVASDKRNGVYITGLFGSTSISFDSSMLINQTPGQSRFFVTKYDSLGNVVWAKSTIGLARSEGWSVSAEDNDHVYISGGFYNAPFTFGSSTVDQISDSSSPIFLLSLDSNGNEICLTSLPGCLNNWNQICVDQSHDVYMGGNFQVSPFIVGNDALSFVGSQSVFLAKYNCNGLSDIENLSQKTVLEIYPNPINAQATATYTLPNNSKNADLIVYDVLGSKRDNYKLANIEGQININVSNLSAGIYFYSLVVDDRVFDTKKIIVL